MLDMCHTKLYDLMDMEEPNKRDIDDYSTLMINPYEIVNIKISNITFIAKSQDDTTETRKLQRGKYNTKTRNFYSQRYLSHHEFS